MDELKILNESKKYPQWSKHLLFWVVITLTFVTRLDIKGEHGFVASSVLTLCATIPSIITAYLFGYYLIPNFFFKKKYLLSFIWFVVIMYFSSALCRYFVVHIAEPFVRIPPFEQESVMEILTDLKMLLFNYFPQNYMVISLFLFTKYFIHITNTKQQALTLGKEKAESELKMLKSQLNPHFLFNTLNNIYMLSLDNSPKTPESIGKLSEILDHVLYRCNGKYVSLSSEITLLENYIALEKLRYDDRLQLTFNHTLESDMEIAPLILLSLVENAFKHGAGRTVAAPKLTLTSLTKPVFLILRSPIQSTKRKKQRIKHP